VALMISCSRMRRRAAAAVRRPSVAGVEFMRSV